MKILLVIPTLQQGGAERVMSELATSWATKGHEVQLVLLAQSDDFYSVPDSVKVHRLGFLNEGRFAKLKEELRVMGELRNLIKKESPTFVLSFMEKFNEFTLLASLGLKVPVYVSDRSNPMKSMGAARKLLKRFTYGKAAGVVAQTCFAKDCLLERTTSKNIKVLRNPIRRVSLYPDNQRSKTIIGVGRLVEEKGFEYLLRAFAAQQDQTWELVLLGEGPLRSELTELAKNLGISERLQMPGAVSNVDEYLSRASIFAFPSVSEGFPNALAEAMIAGLPCVSFDCDAGPRDVIKDKENGYLVKVRDVAGFKECLDALCASKELRDTVGYEASKISPKYKGETVAQEWLEFLSSGAEGEREIE